uniref:Uncharacterized protein n=1 Tax=Vespula pensylvanica TaxID=30213 RepID=A0A834PDT8_VESPE|nr:hypothetical protein H0235_000263 [Vespula pensylvanica]
MPRPTTGLARRCIDATVPIREAPIRVPTLCLAIENDLPDIFFGVDIRKFEVRKFEDAFGVKEARNRPVKLGQGGKRNLVEL